MHCKLPPLGFVARIAALRRARIKEPNKKTARSRYLDPFHVRRSLSQLKSGRTSAAPISAKVIFWRVSSGCSYKRGRAVPAGLIKSPCSDVRESISNIISSNGFTGRCAMPNPKDLIERARMFEERADQARDPISRNHYREMAAHYRSLSVEHQQTRATPERELEPGNSH